jgi:23S rRNA (pseudouridine1915-N3)-methyltransferase
VDKTSFHSLTFILSCGKTKRLVFGIINDMRIKLISVGKLKEKYLAAGIQEYVKRLARFGQVELIELADERIPEQASEKEKALILAKEGQRILSKVPDRSLVFVLAIEGELLTSESFATKVDQAMQEVSTLVFIIGGSLGLDPQVKKSAAHLVSFGRITLPHQLMRLVLVEQIYRAFMIRAGSVYHK